MCGTPAHPMAYQQQYAAEQNPTTSHPQWNYGHPGHPQHPYPQQQPQPPQPPPQHPQQIPQHHSQQPHQMQNRPPYPRSPSRALPPDAQTAHWMNQHYMNGWAYNQSPVPSIAPSVISQSQYADDRMSMLSVNTTMTAHGQDPDAQRCFSSNGSTCENINPDMAFAQIQREAEYVMHNWFSIRDPMKRFDLTYKLHIWLKNKGLVHLDENAATRYIQQIVAIVTDGLVLWTPPDVPPPQEYMALAARLLEIFHKLVQHKPSIPIIATIFASTDGERSLKMLLCPFIPLCGSPQLERCSYIVVEFIATVLLLKNSDSIKIAFLKALKFEKMVNMLIKHLYDAPICNLNVLIIMRNIISRDPNIKEYLIRYNRPKDEPLPNFSLIRTLLECVLPRCANTPQRAPPIVSHTCHLLRTLLHDSKSINDFVRAQGINVVCTLLQRFNDVRIVKDAFNLFLHVSDSPAFQEIEIPLSFILNVLNYFADEEVYKLGTGFLSNIVANKPRFKKDAIQNNAIQLLEMIISKCPRLDDVVEEKKRLLVCEVMSNCLRTLINLLPYWVNNAHLIIQDEAKQNQIITSVHSFIGPNILRKFMNYLSCEMSPKEVESMVELRSYVLRFLNIIIKMPFINKEGLLQITDDVRKENLISHTILVLTWSINIYTGCNKQDKDQREKLVERSMILLGSLMEHCNAAYSIANQCRYVACPLDIIRDTHNESFIRTVLEFCERIADNASDIMTVWVIDRSLVESFANNRNASIAKSATAILSRMPVSSSEPLADLFANSEFY
ncbi:unnamed protein product [Caenorhabditis bovis]|uniref:Uncharacterized protein n=1 Tax=Caenorhabditis bovis TaxID=2654633 RepID=A0A8S1F3D7_9PELO|nr:unnamed protein product [Caenorhabditis bovis]